MGDVLTTLKLMPEDVDVDLEKIKKEIEASMPEEATLQKIEEEPIAFGLVALKVMFTVSDGEGGTDATEQKLRDIEGIKTAEVVEVRLV